MTVTKPRRGLVLGKFLPPHAGHVHLVDFARAHCDELAVVVGTLAREPIPGEVRFGWMRELFPDAHVLHLTDENPQYPEEHPDFWNIWKSSLKRVLPFDIDLVFASEPYGAKLAEVLGAEFVPVDVERVHVPISGTALRADPMTHFRFLPRCVRPWFVRRVCVFGPESTGKTTLARRLAERFETTWVPEFARAYLEARGGVVDDADFAPIARGQISSEEALAKDADRVLFCDTDVLTTTMWSDALRGHCDAWIRAEAERRTYDCYLLTDVDVPFVDDLVRYLPNERRAFHARCVEALETRGRRFVHVRGSWDERFAIAEAAVLELLAEKPEEPT